MQSSTRAFFKRGAAACAAAAIFAGGTFAAGAATAAPQDSGSAAPAATAPATASAPATPDSGLPDGLADAVKRDLGMSMAEFKAQGELADKAAVVQAEVTKVDPAAVVSVNGDSITVQASDADKEPQTAQTAQAAAPAGVTVLTPKTLAAPTKAGAKVDAASVDALFSDYVKTFGARNLFSVAQNASGEFVIRTVEPKTGTPSPAPSGLAKSATLTVDDFAAKYANVSVESADGPAEPHFAPGDPYSVVNGQGYYGTAGPGQGGFLCSVGWNGFNKTGAPAIISAGHCTDDGTTKSTYLTNPANDEAASGNPGTTSILTPLGKVGFSQFGGVNNARTVENPIDGSPIGNIGTDVSVINAIEKNLTQLPKVAQWTNAGSWKPSTPAQISQDPRNVTVTGVASAVVGAPVCKSGRTTGWTCGHVDEIGAYVIAGLHYDPIANPNDLRAVRGFASFVPKGQKEFSDHGDSGGSVISGSLAVGMISGGGTMPDGTTVTISADLKTALAATGGYSVKIFLNTPTLATSGAVLAKGTITGKVAGAPAGTTVTVTIDGTTSNAVVDGTGKWTVKAPNKFGTFPITAQAKNGFSTSASAKLSIKVVKGTLAAPAFTSPALNGTATAPVAAISGIGKAGATIVLSGDVRGTAVVGANGKWSLRIAPGAKVGRYKVTAKQTLRDWNDSPGVTNNFKAVPAAPAIISPANGKQFTAAGAPTVVSGTNVTGATVAVTINGVRYNAKVAGGTWSVSFSARFGSGKHVVSAVQSVSGVASVAGTSTFTVLALPAVQKPGTPHAGTTPPGMQAQGNVAGLATTGASRALPVIGAAGGVLLLLGGGAFLLFRRRNTAK